MIRVKDIGTLATLMEHRYSPLLIQVLKTAALYGPVLISDPNPGNTCLPVQEIYLSADPHDRGQRQQMMQAVNATWQYDRLRDREVVVYESDRRGERIMVRVCDETRRLL